MILATIPNLVAFRELCYPLNAEDRPYDRLYCYCSRSRYQSPRHSIYQISIFVSFLYFFLSSISAAWEGTNHFKDISIGVGGFPLICHLLHYFRLVNLVKNLFPCFRYFYWGNDVILFSRRIPRFE